MRKTMLAALLCAATLALPGGALAQEYVSITELAEQARAMGGVWRESFDTPYGQATVDAPIIVPQTETLPVLTVEKAKISEELFDTIRQGKRTGGKKVHEYETELNGQTMKIYLGEDNYYISGKQTDFTGYDAVTTLTIEHGEFRESPLMPMARPVTYHDIEDVDMDRAYMRGSDLTVGEMLRLWQGDIDLLGEGFVIEPTSIDVKGSNVIANPGGNVIYKRRGYTYVHALQLLEGVAVYGPIITHSIPFITTAESNRIRDGVLKPYSLGAGACRTSLTGIFVDTQSYRTFIDMVKTRSVEIEDIPLAPLSAVLAAVGKEVEAGHVRQVKYIRLGYVLYSNPDMTNYAAAIPRWLVDCEYISDANAAQFKRYGEPKDGTEMAPTLEDENVYVVTGEEGPRSTAYFMKLPVDAQSGQPIIFTTGDEETLRVPDILTWDDVR